MQTLRYGALGLMFQSIWAVNTHAQEATPMVAGSYAGMSLGMGSKVLLTDTEEGAAPNGGGPTTTRPFTRTAGIFAQGDEGSASAPRDVLWRRTRFHFAGEVAMPNNELDRYVETPLVGGAFAVEFASRSRLRPLLDLSGMYARGARQNQFQHTDLQLYASHAGLRWFASSRKEGFHLDCTWGLTLAVGESMGYDGTRPVRRMYASPALSMAAGAGVVIGPAAISARYQFMPDHSPWDTPAKWTGGPGYAVVRVGFTLGGGLRTFSTSSHSGTASSSTAGVSPGKGSTKSQLAWQMARADSLERVAVESTAQVRVLKERQAGLEAQVERQKGMIAAAQAEKEAMQVRSSPQLDGLRYAMLYEPPHRFNAIAVHTMLHVFSDPLALDTFRVVTTSAPGGGYKHELQIATIGGKRYKEELYALPLPGVSPGASTDLERELLRVRMALAPGAFITEPVTVAAWEVSESRDVRDLAFQLSREQFNTVLQDRPEVGFRFQSDERTIKVMVYSRALARIVNIEPE